jgi:hypothetical protein
LTDLLAIDPGNTTGVALFINRDLVLAYATPFEKFISNPERVANELVIEMPKWWPQAHEEIDDLLKVARKVGRIEQHYARLGVRVSDVWPNTWKGSVPKDVHNDRVLKMLKSSELLILPRRSKRAKFPFDRNMLDAVGIGLWKLGRMR